MSDDADADAPSGAQDRYRALVADLGREAGGAKGWKTAVARRLGLSPSHLTRVIAGTRGVGHEALRRAAKEYGFSMLYYESRVGTYRDFAAAAAGDRAIADQLIGDPRALGTLAESIVEAFSKDGPRRADARRLAAAVLHHPAITACARLLELESSMSDREFRIAAAKLAMDLTSFGYGLCGHRDEHDEDDDA